MICLIRPSESRLELDRLANGADDAGVGVGELDAVTVGHVEETIELIEAEGELVLGGQQVLARIVGEAGEVEGEDAGFALGEGDVFDGEDVEHAGVGDEARMPDRA